MFSYQDLTEYLPYKKRVPYVVHMINSGEKPSRPNRDLNRSIVDDKKKVKLGESERVIRSEDTNIRKRVNPASIQGRLTDSMKTIYNDKIESEARKLAMIGEKVITKLFKMDVPDENDADYINRRSKLMAQGMTKEQADKFLKENFREQFKVKAPIDITRMNLIPTKMINIVKEFLSNTTPQTVENAAITQTALNNTLLRPDLSVDAMIDVIRVLEKNPALRSELTPDTTLRPLSILSNFLVGVAVDQMGVKTSELPVDDELNKNLVDGDITDELYDEVKKAASEIKGVLEEKRDEYKDVESVDEFVDDASGDIDDPTEVEMLQEELASAAIPAEEEEEEELAGPKPAEEEKKTPPPPPPPTASSSSTFLQELMKKKEQIAAAKILQAAIRTMIQEQTNPEVKKALIDASNVAKKQGSSILGGILANDLLNVKKTLKKKSDSDKIRPPPETPELTEAQKKVTQLKKVIGVEEKPKPIDNVSDIVSMVRQRSDTIRSRISPEEEKKTEEEEEEEEEWLEDETPEEKMQKKLKLDFKEEVSKTLQEKGTAKPAMNDIKKIIEKYIDKITLGRMKGYLEEITEARKDSSDVIKNINKKINEVEVDEELKNDFTDQIIQKFGGNDVMERIAEKYKSKIDEARMKKLVSDVIVKNKRGEIKFGMMKAISDAFKEGSKPAASFNKNEEMIKFIKKFLIDKINESKIPVKKRIIDIIEKEDERKNPATYLRDILDKDIEKNKPQILTKGYINTIVFPIFKELDEQFNLESYRTKEDISQSLSNFATSNREKWEDNRRGVHLVINALGRKIFPQYKGKDPIKSAEKKVGKPKRFITTPKPKPIEEEEEKKGNGMKKRGRGRPKKEKKPKQNRKPSEWILFVKSVAKTQGIKYGDALRIASLMKK